MSGLKQGACCYLLLLVHQLIYAQEPDTQQAVGMVETGSIERIPALAGNQLDTLSRKRASEKPIAEEIIVTGSRTARYLSDAAVPTQVVNKQQLDMMGIATLAEALTQFSGVYLTETRKQGQSVSINGYPAKHILIMIDGQPITGQGENQDLSLIPTEGIERIEVVKGSMSAFYGSGAMGGVINVITVKPENKMLNSDSLQGQVSYGIHSAVTSEESAVAETYSGRLQGKNAHLELSLKRQQPVDYQQETDIESVGIEQQHRAKLGIQTKFSDVEVHLNPSIEKRFRQKRLDPKNTQEGWLEEFYENKQSIETLDWTLSKKSPRSDSKESLTSEYTAPWSVQGRHQRQQEDSGQTLGTMRNAVRHFNSIRLMTQNPYGELGQFYSEPIGWSLGTQVQQESLEQQTDQGKTEVEGEKQAKRVEVFGLFQWEKDIMELGLSSRVIKDSRFDAKWIQQLQGKQTLIQTPEHETLVRFSLGQGYRAPTLKESYYIFDHSDLGYKLLGNESLKPETSLMSQIGLMWQYQEFLQWQAQFNYDRIDNLIQYQNAGEVDQVTQYRYSNVDLAKIYSFETQAIVSPSAVLNFQLGYTYVDARDRRGPLAHRPRHSIQVGLQYQLSPKMKWMLNGQSRTHEYYETGNSFINDSPSLAIKKAAWTWNIASRYTVLDGVLVDFGIRNLSDQYRGELIQGDFSDARPAIGRQLYAVFHYYF